jgi:hypothetical protein
MGEVYRATDTLLKREVAGAVQAQINLVVNWFEDLKRLVPTK